MPFLNIPEETYAELSVQAAARRLSIEEYVLPILEQAKAESDPQAEPQLPLTGSAWDTAMDAWVREIEARAHLYPAGFVLDDSRETMYFGAEEPQR